MQVPPQYKDSIDVDPSTMTYAPHTWFNDFWLLRDYMVGGGCHPSLCSLHHLPLVFASSSPLPHFLQWKPKAAAAQPAATTAHRCP
jgi:hypothetical protein